MTLLVGIRDGGGGGRRRWEWRWRWVRKRLIAAAEREREGSRSLNSEGADGKWGLRVFRRDRNAEWLQSEPDQTMMRPPRPFAETQAKAPTSKKDLSCLSSRTPCSLSQKLTEYRILCVIDRWSCTQNFLRQWHLTNVFIKNDLIQKLSTKLAWRKAQKATRVISANGIG